MKIIMLTDDKKIGKKHEIKEVADGYARNVLIPKKIAVEATNDNLNKLKNQLAKEQREYEEQKAKAIETKNRLENLKEITLRMKASNNGKMFGAITSKDIAEYLNSINLDVDKRGITLPIAIKDFGGYIAKIKLFPGISAELRILVTPEE